MANNRTSYVRIFRRDGAAMVDDEMEFLYQSTVLNFGEVRSCWTRILREYRHALRCYDIQFGSSKIYRHGDTGRASITFDCPESVSCVYDIFERVADEGGAPDQLNYHHSRLDACRSEPCVYAFDTIRLSGTSLLPHFEGCGAPRALETGALEIALGGTYTASNDLTWVDAGDEGAEPYVYDPTYKRSEHTLNCRGSISDISLAVLRPLIHYGQPALPVGTGIDLCFQGRITQRFTRSLAGRLSSLSADHWDNCCNELYRGYLEQRHR